MTISLRLSQTVRTDSFTFSSERQTKTLEIRCETASSKVPDISRGTPVEVQEHTAVIASYGQLGDGQVQLQHTSSPEAILHYT